MKLHLCLRLAVALALPVAACTPARMALAPGLAPASALEVRGRNTLKWDEEFAFGAWSAQKVERGWKTATSWNLPWGVSSAEVGQPFEFQLVRAGRPLLLALATTGANKVQLEAVLFKGLPIEVTLEDKATLAVTFAARGEADPLQAIRLLVRGHVDTPLSGLLVAPGLQPIEVKGTAALEGTPLGMSETSGYTFERKGKALGAVEVINAGRVWIEAGLPEAERDALAAAAAALLLYRGPELDGR